MWPIWKRGSFGMESTSKYSSACTHAYLCVYVCVRECARVFGVLFIYSSACGRWPTEGAEGHGKTSTLPHVSSFLSHPLCVVTYTLCVLSRLLKIDSVPTIRNKSTPCSCKVILEHKDAVFRAKPFITNFY